MKHHGSFRKKGTIQNNVLFLKTSYYSNGNNVPTSHAMFTLGSPCMGQLL
jgi:hypothetical protein